MKQEQLPSNESWTDYDQIELRNIHPREWRNPQPAQIYNLVVIGGGPAGFLTALKAVRQGAKVALVERDLLGGVCFNDGCIPSKSMIRPARLYAEMRNAENFGAQVPSGIQVDFAYVMERMRRIRLASAVGFRLIVCARLVSTSFSGKDGSPVPMRLRSTASVFASSAP